MITNFLLKVFPRVSTAMFAAALVQGFSQDLVHRHQKDVKNNTTLFWHYFSIQAASR